MRSSASMRERFNRTAKGLSADHKPARPLIRLASLHALCLIALAVILAVTIIAMPVGSALADQAELEQPDAELAEREQLDAKLAERDAKLAEQLFEEKRAEEEQERRMIEIFDWANARAEAAVRNSPTGRDHQARLDETDENCRNVESSPTVTPGAITRTCGDSLRRMWKPDEEIVEKLRQRFIRERLTEEFDEAVEILMEHMKRLMEETGRTDGIDESKGQAV